MNRRHALQTSLAAAGAGFLIPGLSGTASAALSTKPIMLGKNDVVLFQGDSITDARRDRKGKNANNDGAMGRGYPFLLASYLLMRHPDLRLQFFNRGVSGNKVPNLDQRWQTDCIDLKPNVVSILVGVNDIWHKLNGNYDGTVDDYETGFTALLDRTRAALPDARLVICEPFVMRCGAVKDSWFPEFDERKAVAKSVAEKAGAIWVPFQEAFDAEVAKGTKPGYWAGDGVHPTMAGHALMANVWLESTKIR